MIWLGVFGSRGWGESETIEVGGLAKTMEDDFPRAFCHEDEMQEMIDKWEAKHSTPISEQEIQEFMAAVHFDKEDCECDCCASC